ncbi:MAG: hypothetical protein SCARUB_03411 [Candidatus Scalindua rubra]|uniref:Protein BatD n=1 Tax=Candidatus Scalindua rubra TaxID=1872076 RepID=A0A1E3X912_9BACT|nr:MAG: hypothetical protein SCARUB_03411 [Candidatus Scalindua rubra]
MAFSTNYLFTIPKTKKICKGGQVLNIDKNRRQHIADTIAFCQYSRPDPKCLKYTVFILVVLVCTRYVCMAEDVYEEDVREEGSNLIVKVNANVDNAKTTIGDKIRYKISVDFPKEIEVLFPEIMDEIAGLAVVDSGTEKLEKDEGRIMLERWYDLETYNTGSYVIPALEIKYKKKGKLEDEIVKTPEVFVEVVSILDEKASDIRDIKPPVVINKNYYRLYVIIAIVLCVLALAAIVLHFLYRRKHRKIEFVPEPLPAHKIAYNELEKLKALNLISKGLVKEYYYRLSNIVRHYIENRFKLMAPERTTEEFLTEMTTTYKLEKVHKELIGNFLEHCDMVKFAAYGPDTQEIENAFNLAEKLVDETREVLQSEVTVHKRKILDRITG